MAMSQFLSKNLKNCPDAGFKKTEKISKITRKRSTSFTIVKNNFPLSGKGDILIMGYECNMHIFPYTDNSISPK